MKKIKWLGSKICDICKKPVGKYLFDARTSYGPWAVMCIDCYNDVGIYPGQMYEEQDGEYMKING